MHGGCIYHAVQAYGHGTIMTLVVTIQSIVGDIQQGRVQDRLLGEQTLKSYHPSHC